MKKKRKEKKENKKKKRKKRKEKKEKKMMQNLNWVTANLNLSTGSRYSHCIVTPRLENWPGGEETVSRYKFCIVTEKGLNG